MNKPVKIIDLTLRDAHQCLWATRMTTAMMKDIAPLLDRAGFEAIDLVGGAVFDVCVRYLREDPWGERMRILSSWVKETPLIIHTGVRVFLHSSFSRMTWSRFQPSDLPRTGCGITHPTMQSMTFETWKFRYVRPNRLDCTRLAGLYSPRVRFIPMSFYANKAKELIKLGVDGVYIKDASGLLRPDRALTLVPAIKRVIGDLELQLHSHCLSGLAPYTALLAVDCGVEVVHTATSTMANGASHSPTELFVRNCRRRGHRVDLDLETGRGGGGPTRLSCQDCGQALG